MLPAKVVDSPEDPGLMSPGEAGGPDIAVAFVPRDVQTVNHGHAAGEFAGRFDIHEMFRLRSHDRRVQRNGHSDRVWQGDPVFSRLLEESLLGAAVALDGEFGDGCGET